MTTRRWMIVVAGTGIALGAGFGYYRMVASARDPVGVLFVIPVLALLIGVPIAYLVQGVLQVAHVIPPRRPADVPRRRF